MPLIAAGADIGQLVILAILFVGWVIKEVAESRKRNARGAPRRRPASPPVEQGDAPAPSPRSQPEPDIIYGSRPVPHLPAPPAQSTTPAKIPQLKQSRTPTRKPTRPQRPQRAPTAAAPERRALGQQLVADGTTAATTTSTLAQRRRRGVLRRLGMAEDSRSVRDHARLAVLWSEVLGPCRAMRGPHRAPETWRRR